MRQLVLIAIFCSGVLYAPLPLIAKKGGEQPPLMPVVDIPSEKHGATAPGEKPLEVDAGEVPGLVPPKEVGGGAEAPEDEPAPETTPEPAPEPEPMPEPEPAPAPAPTVPEAPPLEPMPTRTNSVRDAAPAQAPDEEPEGEEPVGEVPDQAPTAPEPAPDEEAQDDEQFEEDFGGDETEGQDQVEEDFGEGPEPAEPNAPAVIPEATAGPQLPQTGGALPALLLSGLALSASGMSLRALCRDRS